MDGVKKMSRPLKVLIIGDGDAGKTSLRSRYLTDQFKPAYRATIGADFVSKTIEVSVPVPRESRRRRRLSTASSSDSCHSNCEVDDQTEQQQQQAEAGSSSQPPKGKTKADQQKRPPLQHSNTSGLAAATAAKHQEKVRVTLSIWDTAGQERFRSLGTAFYRGADAVIIAFDVTNKGALARTLSWYRDFCSMGDLSDESDFGLTPKQRRKAKEQRERFCWVAVGCKGDLFTDLKKEKRSKSQDDDWLGTPWQVARSWFDGLQTRYLPPTESETNSFAQFDPAIQAAQLPQPYAIHDEVPANPADVLSRPSPKKQSIEINTNNSSDSKTDARHPQAGTPPGDAQTPGKNAKLVEQPSPLKRGNQKKVHPIELWQEGLPIPKANGGNGKSADSTLRSGTYERSRYDSTTSQSGNSIYYSVRGSTMMSQSPATPSSSSPTPNGRGNGASRSSKPNNGSHTRDASLNSRQSFGNGSLRSRKKSNLSEVLVDDTDDSSVTQSQKPVKPPLVSIDSEQSSSARTERAGPKQENAKKESSEKEDLEDSIAAISTVPSGDPIPFPTENDEEKEEQMEGMRARRRKRLSRMSQKRQSIASLSAIEADETAIIAERTKEQRLEEQEEIREIEDDERAHMKRSLKIPKEEMDDKRMTLYSARPSSTTSTIRPADADVLQDGDATEIIDANQSNPQHNNNNDTNHDESLAVLDDQNRDSDAESDLYEDHIEQGFRLFYTSAKTGNSIDDVFQHIAHRVALKWTYEEWEEAQRRQAWGYGPEGEVRTAPPTNEEIERERVKRAIKISQGKGTGGCCS
ncbi:hypothetical protein L7F22_054036 [Adiantum nelumboides]|nr:hypothetical protein [Adiantum nelumboides]